MENQKSSKKNQEQKAYIIRRGEQIQNEISQAIKHERIARGLKRSTLATLSGISEDTLARIESGEQDYLVGNLCRVWAALGIKEDYVQPHKLRERNKIIREIVERLNLLKD